MAASAAQHPWSWARGPSWWYLRVGEIVEEEGGELFVQQRAAVVPRHLPDAAAACRGVSAEPAGGRERASEGGGRREQGRREAEGGAQAQAAAGPLAAEAGPLGACASRGSSPHFPAPRLKPRSSPVVPSLEESACSRVTVPSLQPDSCAAMRAAPHFCQNESRCLSAGRVLRDNPLLRCWGN